ncbi:hypothetical protein [Corynebacterium sp.]|uniref:Rv1157c family protein n=1 Tax=Corynebacterium sp. TaxID=1720 RepID=UPI0026DBD5F6|nr:hypothetical protein [Corynebacterium sp.]MDO5076476.1 hypothetical protein [Corynebacterium sp.]
MRYVVKRLAAVLAAMSIACCPIFSSPPAASADPLAVPLSFDHLGRPSEGTLDHLRGLSDAPWLPAPARETLDAAITFFEGSSGGGVALPEDAPKFSQFLWPTTADRCIAGEHRATGTMIAVPGPADLPMPGVPEQQSAFVFTALGTGPADPDHGGMTVHWLNVHNLRFGSTHLTAQGINAEGPATVSGIANTGRGTVVAIAIGGVSTEGHVCNFIPTAGMFTV